MPLRQGLTLTNAPRFAGALGLCLLAQPAAALGECARFGKSDYTADRTVEVGGQTFRSKIVGSGVKERETTDFGDHVIIRLSTPGKVISFDPARKTGVAQVMAPPPRRPAKDSVRVSISDQGGTKLLKLELRDGKGAWHIVNETSCRVDGVLLGQTFTVPANGQVITGHMSQVIISTGPVDPGLFKVPSDISLGK